MIDKSDSYENLVIIPALPFISYQFKYMGSECHLSAIKLLISIMSMVHSCGQ